MGRRDAEVVTFIPASSPVPTMIVGSDKEAKISDQEDESEKRGRWSHIDVWLVVCGKLISHVVDWDAETPNLRMKICKGIKRRGLYIVLEHSW